MVYGDLYLARDQQVYRLLGRARDLAFEAVVCRLLGHARDQCCLCCWTRCPDHDKVAVGCPHTAGPPHRLLHNPELHPSHVTVQVPGLAHDSISSQVHL